METLHLFADQLTCVADTGLVDVIYIEDLAKNIREMGQFTPVPIRLNNEGKYEYESGFCRVQACRMLNQKVICVVVDQFEPIQKMNIT